MKNIYKHSEQIFGSILEIGLKEYDPNDPDADRCYAVYRIYDNEQTFYSVYTNFNEALTVYNQIKYKPIWME